MHTEWPIYRGYAVWKTTCWCHEWIIRNKLISSIFFTLTTGNVVCLLQKDAIKLWLKTVDRDDYDLDEFLKLLQLLPKDSDENIIKDFKERFKKEYDETSEALEWHIETLVNFGGDSTHKIYKAMIEVINDIINDAPSTDKDGMIEYLQEMI